jgi:hypothetical protein
MGIGFYQDFQICMVMFLLVEFIFLLVSFCTGLGPFRWVFVFTCWAGFWFLYPLPFAFIGLAGWVYV